MKKKKDFSVKKDLFAIRTIQGIFYCHLKIREIAFPKKFIQPFWIRIIIHCIQQWFQKKNLTKFDQKIWHIKSLAFYPRSEYTNASELIICVVWWGVGKLLLVYMRIDMKRQISISHWRSQKQELTFGLVLIIYSIIRFP